MTTHTVLSKVFNNTKINIALSIFALINFYIFSRLTIDDAFISWRYGVNFVDHLIWGYNPSINDLTQSYTNPLFAFLSIIPVYLDINIVLFFKLFSLFVSAIFFTWFYKKTKALFPILIFFIIPATIIHTFSGLETFIWAIMLVVLFHNIYVGNTLAILLCSSCLMLIRPEAWLLPALVFFYFLSSDNQTQYNPWKLFKFSITNQSRYVIAFTALSVLFFALFSFLYLHKQHFGFYLPNTFYVKTGGLNIQSFPSLILFCLFLLPLLILRRNKQPAVFYVFFFLFLAMAINYSISSLAMNYADRFLFHIFAPIYLIATYYVYISKTGKEQSIHIYFDKDQNGVTLNYLYIFKCLIVLYAAVFFIVQYNAKELASITNYYPRALESHSSLGKTIDTIKEKYNVKSMLFGDAGMTAFYADIRSLDNIGLGSSLVTHAGEVTKDILEEYNPDIVVFHARPEKQIRTKDYSQRYILDWSENKGLIPACEVIFSDSYSLYVYTKSEMSSEFDQVCLQSRKQNWKKDKAYLIENLRNPPWYYWH